MKKVNQTIFDNITGDCFRACLASIFEISIESVPNFWVDTQDVSEFWKLSNDWCAENLKHRCMTVEISNGHGYMIENVLCIACAKSPRNDCDHAVVWKNGIIHDPHPSNSGLAVEPTTFTVFLPLDPMISDCGKALKFCGC